MAYHTADYERWQQLDFVVGIEIRLSNNHTLNGKSFEDICDELQGKYPKDFKFTGWHPQCRCHVISILKTPEELAKHNEQILNGEMPDTYSENTVKDVPENFKNWINDNADRIEMANNRGTLPDFLKDNATFVDVEKIGVSQEQLFNMYKKFKNGGEIEIIDGYKKKPDHKDLISISRGFAKNGNSVKITTNIHFKDEKYKEVFGGLIGTKYERKCPDLIINGEFYEYENYLPPFNKEKISHMIKRGSAQSSRIIINNNKGASDRYIRNNIYKRLKDKNFKYDIDEVWLYEKGIVRMLYKKQ